MSSYAKFMKELVTRKRSLDFEMIEVSHSCSAIISKELIEKKDDPGAFTIPCTIGLLKFAKALCDLGAMLVDVESGELKFWVNDDEVTFDVCKSMKHPSDIHGISTDDVIDEAVASVSHLMCSKEPLDVV
ncbi:hypothetical protein R3W88_016348 [Solanum pinnatisectum]|uniref:Proliferating cell nuclear antigen PCNA N-terminal domain-containing protein n=1 Tax=Solanum pinnatisectum TaxID=50273 RepID=A0AAV9L086_9SOLN|nr:hypothetical protein R3W88_016348 [Solanum pinnatisectum]